MSRLAQQTIRDPGTRLGVAEVGRDPKNFKLRTAQRESERKRIVDVVTYVGVNDDLLAGK
jgi:hypothetical protein